MSRHMVGIGSPEPGTPTLTKIKPDYGALNPSISDGVAPPGISPEASGGMAAAPGGGLSDREKELVYDLAMSAMDELVQMSQADDALWHRSMAPGNAEVLNIDEYTRRFPNRLGPSPAGLTQEASRASGLVVMSGSALVEIVMDPVSFHARVSTLDSRV